MSLIKITILAEDETADATESAKKRAKQLEDSVQNVTNRLKSLGVATLAAFTLSLNVFADFDKGVREIGALLNEVTNESIASMGDEIRALGIEYGQTADVMTKARIDVINEGFTDAADSAQLLSAAAKLASGSVSEVSKTTEVLTSVLNAYKLGASDSIRISDMLFTTVRLGRTTIDDLASTIGKAADIAPTLGVSFEELSAGVVTFTNQGLKTEKAVDALQAIMESLLNPAAAMKTALADIGFESGASAVRTLGFAETLRLLTEGINETDLAARFPNVREMKTIFPLAGEAATKFRDNLDTIRNSTGATDVAFEKMTTSASFQITQLQERWRGVMIDMGKAAVPVLNALTSLVESFTSLSGVAQTSILTIGGLILSISLLSPLVKVLNASLVTTGISMTGLATAIKGLFASLGPTGWLIIGLSALIPIIAGFDSSLQAAESQLTTTATVLDNMGRSVETVEENLRKSNQELETFVENIESFNISQLENEIAKLEQKKLEITLGIKPGESFEEQFSLDDITNVGEDLTFDFDFVTTGVDATNQAISSVGENLEDLTGVIDRQIEAAKSKLMELQGTAGGLSGDIPPVKIGLEVDDNELLAEFESILTGLKRQATDLKAKAIIDIETKGEISQKVQDAINEIQSAIPVVQGQIDKLVDSSFDKNMAAVEEFFAETGEDFDAFNDEWIKKLADRKAKELELEIQKRDALKSLRDEFLLSDQEREVQHLINRLNLWNENWRQLEEGQRIFNEAMTQINNKFRSDERVEWMGMITDIQQAWTNQIAGVAFDVIDRNFEVLTRNMRNDFGEFISEMVASFLKALARMVAEALAAKLVEKIFGGGTGGAAGAGGGGLGGALSGAGVGAAIGGPLGGAIGAGLGLAGLLNQGGIIGGDRQLGPNERIAIMFPSGKDTVPAMLTPGEAVIPADTVSRNRPLIDSLLGNSPLFAQTGGVVQDNQTLIGSSSVRESTVSSQTIINVSPQFVINSQSLDPVAARNAIIEFVRSDAFRREMKRSVNNGDLPIEVDSKRAEVI